MLKTNRFCWRICSTHFISSIVIVVLYPMITHLHANQANSDNYGYLVMCGVLAYTETYWPEMSHCACANTRAISCLYEHMMFLFLFLFLTVNVHDQLADHSDIACMVPHVCMWCGPMYLMYCGVCFGIFRAKKSRIPTGTSSCKHGLYTRPGPRVGRQ
jgi:CDP-diglyceride synthetase